MTSALRTLVYLRKSTADPRARGDSRSVTEQRAEVTAWAAREGWVIVGEEVDDGVSASRHGRGQRTGWEAVKTRLAAGGIDLLCTWEASRAQRDLAAYAELRTLCAALGVRWAYSGQVYDLSERGDRFRTGLDALVAEDESERTRERVLRAVNANAAAGRPHGRRLFGYRRLYDPATGALVGQEPHEDEAPLVAEIVDRVARGDSLRGLAHELNERGLTTSTGSPWTASTVRRTARNLAFAGLRVHLDEVHPGDWPAIVPEHLVRAARARTDGNERSRRMPSSAPVHLLSGLARCGICGDKLFRGHDRNGVHVYQCRRRDYVTPEGQRLGIGHLTVRKDPVDLLVTEAVAAWLDHDQADGLIAAAMNGGDNPAALETASLRQRLDDAAEAYAAGRLTLATLAKVEADLLPAIAEAEARARRVALSPAVADALGHDFRSLPLAQQREVIASLVTVTVNKGTRTRTFDPERVFLRFNV
jgi:DNA invertase Pin-like site-specific DNA recombinase